MKREIPKEAKDIIVNGVETVLFPEPAKTKGGKIARFLFQILKIFVSVKKINIKI